MNEKRLLRKITAGSVANVDFDDLCCLLDSLGFELTRVSGSHHIFTHESVGAIVNIQEVRGQAKPYQVRQIASLVRRYNLSLEA